MVKQLIAKEDFASVQEAQAGITKLFQRAQKAGKFIRVMRNQEPLGVLIPNDLWLSIVEDMEAMASPKYKRDIMESRQDTKRYTAEQVKKIVDSQ